MVVCLLGGWWWTAKRRLDDDVAALVQRSHALLQEPAVPDRSPDATQAGTTIGRILAVYPTLAAELVPWDVQEEPAVYRRCGDVRDGRWPLSDLPSACRDATDVLVPEIDALVAASKAASVGPAADWLQLKWWPLARAATVVALRARILLVEDDDAQTALQLCVAMASLWRDATHAGGLQTVTAAGVLIRRMDAVCLASLHNADRQTRGPVATALTQTLESVAPLARAVARESLLGELSAFAPRLDVQMRARLHPLARYRVDQAELGGLGADHEPWWLAPFVVPQVWRAYTVAMDDIAQCVDEPTVTAVSRIDAVLADPALPDLARTAASAAWRRVVGEHHDTVARVAAWQALAAVQPR